MSPWTAGTHCSKYKRKAALSWMPGVWGLRRRDYFPVIGAGNFSKYRKVPQLHEDDSGEVQNLEEKGDSGDPLPRRGHPATESQKFSRRM